MKRNRTYVEKLALADFRAITFPFGNLPHLALDFFRYVTLCDVKQHYLDKAAAELQAKTQQPENKYLLKREELLNPVQEEIEVWRQRLGEKLFGKIFRAFRSLCRNGDEENAKEHQLFLTEQTMQKNLPRLFGYKNDFLASRIYMLISGNVKDKRVFFPQYVAGVNPLLRGSEQVKQRFVFQLYDVDHDGVLNGFDLVQFC